MLFLKTAMTWLKKYNSLYEKYIPQGETVKPFLQQTVYSHFPGLPKWTNDMVIAHGGQLPVKRYTKSRWSSVPFFKFYPSSNSNTN